jgi:hypothetical protein
MEQTRLVDYFNESSVRIKMNALISISCSGTYYAGVIFLFFSSDTYYNEEVLGEEILDNVGDASGFRTHYAYFSQR